MDNAQTWPPVPEKKKADEGAAAQDNDEKRLTLFEQLAYNGELKQNKPLYRS